MFKMAENPTFNDALFIWERHRRIIRLQPRGKTPVDSWDDSPQTLAYVRKYWGIEQKARFNVGMVMGSELVVVDADSVENARALYRRLPKTDMMTKTGKGVHFFYKGTGEDIGPKVKVLVQGIEADIRANMSYVVGAGVHESGKQYERVGNWNLTDVPDFDSSWIEEKRGRRTDKVPNHIDAYLSKVESIQGKNGSGGLVRAVQLCRNAGLTESQATIKLLEWNRGSTVCPSWADEEIARAIHNVFKQGVAS